MSILKIIIAILIFGLIVLIHEFGHFIVARICGVKVIEFSIGMGPRILSLNGKKTRFSLKCIPFGGSCIMKSNALDDDGQVLDEEKAAEKELNPDDDSFDVKTPFQRFWIIFAGPFFNFILAFIAAIILIACVGTDKPIISDVMKGFPAQQQGMMAGDEITSINGSRVKVYREIQMYLALYPDRELDLGLKREDKKLNIHVKPKYDPSSDRFLIGIISTGEAQKPSNVWETLKYAWYEVRYSIKTAIESLKYMISGRAKKGDIQGPVGVISSIGDTVEESSKMGGSVVFLTIVNIIVIFSANLGVINLLPVPALDGGRLVFIIIEGAIGKPINKKVENTITAICFMLLMAFMIYILFSDIGTLFGK